MYILNIITLFTKSVLYYALQLCLTFQAKKKKNTMKGVIKITANILQETVEDIHTLMLIYSVAHYLFLAVYTRINKSKLFLVHLWK